jgi:phage-related protein
MSKGFKGIEVVIDGDTSKFRKELDNLNKDTRSLQSELKGINTLMKLDPSSTELAAQKQVVLRQAVQETEAKLKLLEEAEKQAAAAGMNVNDEGYRDLQREIALTKSKLEDLKKEQSAFDALKNGAKSFGSAIGDIATKIPVVKKLADGFGNVKEKITDAVKNNDKIKAIGTAVEGAKAKVEAFKDAHPAVKKIADGFKSVGEAVDIAKNKLPSLSQAVQAAGQAAVTAGKTGFQVLETTISGTIKAFTAYATAAVTAGVAVTKQAVENYASYEQLVGGVETLFGAGGQSLSEYAKSVGKTTSEAREEYNSLMTAQETVLKNADNAYKTAGLSANDYMETVTSFSAALISSLDGDTEAAATKADQAITDMSDNANKMGTDMSAIQSAYNGFAKQNYTMLDNLKLGYGGTKEEMQRLLEDATALSGVEYDISSYADIVDAIHVVQTEMGITGTTAKEASTTIEGSINSAKAAYENLLTGLADEDADLDALIDNMIDSVETVVDNVVPVILQTVNSVITKIPEIITKFSGVAGELAGEAVGLAEEVLPQLETSFFSIISSLIDMLPEMLPTLLQAAVEFFMGILDGLNEVIPQLAAQIPVLIEQITTTLTENLPQIISAGVLILVNMIQGITNAIPSLIEAVIALFPVITNAILENLPLIIEAGLNLLIALIEGIVEAIPQLIAMLPEIITAIVSTLASMLPQIIEAGITLLNSLISGIIQAIPQLIAALPQVISSIINTIIQNLPKIISSGIELIGALISGLIQAIPSLVAAIPQIVAAIFNTIKAVNWGELGKNIIDGVITGIKNAADSLINVFKDLASSALSAVKDFFGIASPSKVMRDQVGKMIPAGMAVGVEEGMDEEEDRIKDAMRKGVPTTIDSYINTKAGTTAAGSSTGSSGFVQNVTINSPRELSPSETARQTRNATRQMVLKLKPA